MTKSWEQNLHPPSPHPTNTVPTVNVAEDSPFTLHNIPFGVISTDANPLPHCATAIGDYALDLPLFWKHRSSEQLERLSLSCEGLHNIFNPVSVIVFINCSQSS
jgi:fumarylacetoacetase